MSGYLSTIGAGVREKGYTFVTGSTMLDLLPTGVLEAWPQFAQGWDDLVEDDYRADAGRYRRRRYAAYRITPTAITRLPHRPHYQGLRFNRLNGGIERWFSPVTPTFDGNPVTRAILMACHALFVACEAREITGNYDVEMHQFRIEAGPGGAASPTPEGMHRDGVDWACAMLIGRHNVRHGTTRIEQNDGVELATSTLRYPLDALFLDDRRIRHGVTDISRLDPLQTGFRDVLVITFRAILDTPAAS